MHLLILIILLALVVLLVVSQMQGGPSPSPRNIDSQLVRPFTYIHNGSIYRRDASGRVLELESPFQKEVIRRQQRSVEKHAWKNGTTFNVQAGGGLRRFDTAVKPFAATSVAYRNNGHLLYFLKDDSVGGLFSQDPESGKELRLLLQQNLDLSDIAPSPDGEKLAASSSQPGGTANIALMDAEGGQYREVTDGDTIDTSPAWIPGDADSLLFQSVGFARNQEGFIMAQGNASIQMLDMNSNRITPVLESPDFDYLSPRVHPSGELLFIRRPFDLSDYGLADSVRDTVFLPFRLLRALFHYLNFFSLMYSRKPLTSADNPHLQADMNNILLQGKRIDAEKALRQAHAVKGVPSLVPNTWQLVSRNKQGQEQVLATSVAAFDVFEDGTIVYSNGQGAFILQNDGAHGVIHSGELIPNVVAG